MSRPAWMNAPQQPCARCGNPTYSTANPPLHRKCQQRAAPRSEKTWAERRRRKAAVDAHRAEFGDVCPGWGRAPHVVVRPNRLSADHVVSVARGGAEGGPLQVICVRCNSSKREKSGTVRAPTRSQTATYSPSRAW